MPEISIFEYSLIGTVFSLIYLAITKIAYEREIKIEECFNAAVIFLGWPFVLAVFLILILGCIIGLSFFGIGIVLKYLYLTLEWVVEKGYKKFTKETGEIK